MDRVEVVDPQSTMARREKTHEEVLEMVQENRTEGLLVRAEPLEWAEEISHRMVDVVRIKDGALVLDAESTWEEMLIRVQA